MNVLTTLRKEQNGNKTILEQQGNITLRENQSAQKISGAFSEFRGFTVKKQLPSNSTEADIFIIAYNSINYVLKLYRYGIEPKAEILKNVIALGKKYPDKFLQVLQADYDSTTKRWFEIQEYIKLGSFQKILDQLNKFNDEQKNFLFRALAREIGQELNILHSNNLLHLDIKPSNILMRSYKPFNLVLIDFGISTLLASDMSKKFTQTRGTPMYQSPESWAGSMNRASDWWGLGMILLEIASGKHPFSGLDYKVIASIMATRSVEIPENISDDKKEILRGLLTRDPDKRWKWEQVSRWLKGERNIGDSFQESSIKLDNKRKNLNPIKFMGEQCYSLEDFSACAAKNEESWDKAAGFLMRGYVRQWLEENKDFDTSVEIDNMINPINDSDEKLFRLIQNFGKNIPFVFCGHMITLKNLLIFLGKSLRRENLSTHEQKIVNAYQNGGMLSCVKFMTEINKEILSPEVKALKIFLEDSSTKNSDLAFRVGILDFCVNLENYYCPFINNQADIISLVNFSKSFTQVPLNLFKWRELDEKFFIPPEILTAMKSSAYEYDSALQILLELEEKEILLPKSDYSDREKKLIKRLLPMLEIEHRTREFIDFYLYPKKYFCPFMKGVTTLDEFISRAKHLTAPPKLLSEWQELNNKYILPSFLVEGMNFPETYSKCLDSITGLENVEGLLIPRQGNEDFIKNIAECKSIEDYAGISNGFKLGYDDESVKIIYEALKDFQSRKQGANELESAKNEMVISYLQLLSECKKPLTDEDKKFLRGIKDISYERAEELAKYIESIDKIDKNTLDNAEKFLITYATYSTEKIRERSMIYGVLTLIATILIPSFKDIAILLGNISDSLVLLAWGIKVLIWGFSGWMFRLVIDPKGKPNELATNFIIVYCIISYYVVIL